MTLEQTIAAIRPLCAQSAEEAKQYFSSIAIPLGSLGMLQDAIVQIAGIQHQAHPKISQRSVAVFCADNGVVAQGVTQCGQDVTAIVTENLNRAQTSVCRMALHTNVRVLPIDIGVACDVQGEKIIRRKIAYGTQDMTQAPAMTREDCIRALEIGIEMAEKCKADGDHIVAVGEMGIGNTTSTAAVTAVLTGRPVTEVTGRGAGLSTEGLHRKIAAIEKAIALNQPDPSDVVDVISKVGGFDIAGITGFYLGAAAQGMPIVADGVITAAAALCAVRLCPAVQDYIIFAHESQEPAGRVLLDTLSVHPFITAGMRLGEGTGAIAAIALLDLAFAVYDEMPCFADTAIEAYQPLT